MRDTTRAAEQVQVEAIRRLAWLLAQGDPSTGSGLAPSTGSGLAPSTGSGLAIAPIPGTKRVTRVEANTAADGVVLSAEQVGRLNNLTPASGERHDAGNMAVIDR